jgi:hypothetical protein
MRATDFGQKPNNTRIQLNKGGDLFEVHIPPIGFHPIILFMVPFAIIWNWGLVNWLLSFTLVPFPGIIFVMIFSLPFWAADGFLVCICLFILFGKIYFRIDRHEICLTKTIFGVKINRERPKPKREVTKLIFTRKHSSRNNNEDISAALKIEISTRSIVLGGSAGCIQHEAEVEWLAYEVSEWLDKPLKIY